MCITIQPMEKVHIDLDKQIHLEVDTLVSFVIQSGQMSEVGAISLSHHVDYFETTLFTR